MKKVSVIIVAAGEGKRFGQRKQFALLKGKTVLGRCLETFDSHPRVKEIVLVLPDEERKEEYLALSKKIVAIVKGGPKRQDSVQRGFEALSPGRVQVVLVHDGVRPLLGEEVISRVIKAVEEGGAAVPVVPVEDTLKEVEGKRVLRTIDRKRLFRVQTPQGFSYSLLKRALEAAARNNFYATDEAMLIERLGEKVLVVEGDPKNIKVTTPEDIKIAEALLGD